MFEFAQTSVHWVSDAIQLSHPLWRPLLLPSIFPSIRVFSNETVFSIRWPKFWGFSFSISASKEYSGLISCRLDWLWSPCCPRDSQESFPEPHFESNSSVLRFLYGPTFLSVHDYWKKHSLTIQTFAGKVTSLFFNKLSRFVITFLRRRKCLWNSWLQSLSAVNWKPKKIKSLTISTFAPPICHEVMGLDAMLFICWMLKFKPAFSSLLFHSHQEALFTFFH